MYHDVIEFIYAEVDLVNVISCKKACFAFLRIEGLDGKCTRMLTVGVEIGFVLQEVLILDEADRLLHMGFKTRYCSWYSHRNVANVDVVMFNHPMKSFITQ